LRVTGNELIEDLNVEEPGGGHAALAPAAMCYMMSKQQYLNDQGKSWHPHLMFYVAGDAAQSWGANLQARRGSR